jgi:hypothetical protein
MKVIAHTTGAFQLLDAFSGDLIPAHRPAVIEKTMFITARLAIEQVKIVAEVNSSATDAQFVKHWKDSDGDMDLAIQSFLAIYGLDVVAQEDVAREREAEAETAAQEPEAAPAPDAKKTSKK